MSQKYFRFSYGGKNKLYFKPPGVKQWILGHRMTYVAGKKKSHQAYISTTGSEKINLTSLEYPTVDTD